jgi:hypothetical protein
MPELSDAAHDIEQLVRSFDALTESKLGGDGEFPSAAELAHSTASLSASIKWLSALNAEVQTCLAESMIDDAEEIDGLRVERKQSVSFSWDGDGARAAVVDRLVERYAVDQVSGELHMNVKRILQSALREAFAVVSAAPKAAMNVSGLKSLNVNPNDYRSSKEGAWRVSAKPLTGEDDA